MRETEISNLKSKIEKLNSANFELKKTISGFEREHETMKVKIRSLERKNNQYHENVQVTLRSTPILPSCYPRFTHFTLVLQKKVEAEITKIESQLEDVKVQLDQSEASNHVDMNEATDMIALDSDEDVTCVDGETSPVIQRSGSRGGSTGNMPICSESENSNDCLFGGLLSDEESTNRKTATKPEKSTIENPIEPINEKERPKRRYDPSNPPLHSKSEVFLRKLHQAQARFQTDVLS